MFTAMVWILQNINFSETGSSFQSKPVSDLVLKKHLPVEGKIIKAGACIMSFPLVVDITCTSGVVNGVESLKTFRV